MPAIASSLLRTLVFVVDRVMLGHHSPASLAAMQLAGPVEWSVLSIFLAFEVGTLARVGNLVGKGDTASARRAIVASLGLAVVLGFGLLAASPLVGVVLPLAAPHASIAVVEASSAYLSITLAASPLAFVSAAATASLQASGDTRTSLAIGTLANIVHVAVNRVLIMGAFGVPAMGARGAGISMAITFAIEASLGVAALTRPGGAVSLRRTSGRTQRGGYVAELRAIGRVGLPSMLERIVYHTGFLAYVGVIASLGDASMAANQALISIESICFLSGDGFGVAAASIVARRIGASRPAEARQAMLLSARWAAILLTVFGLAALLLRGVLLPMFSSLPEVCDIGSRSMPVLALAQPFMAVGIVLSQSLRGAGRTRAALLVSLVGALLVRVSCTWLFAIEWHLGLTGVWMGSTADWIVRSALLFWLSRKPQSA